MSTWDHRLGLIVPSWNTVMEFEMQRMAAGVMSIHTERIRHTADTEGNLAWMSTQAPQAAELLSHAKVDALIYGCTGSGFLKTPADDRALAAQLEAATGIPAMTTSASVADALRAIGARRISVASPYEPWLNEKLRTYLERDGFEILAMQGLGTQSHASISVERVMALAAEVARPGTEAVFISCSNFRTLDIIEPLEASLGKPVVTSNQASMWALLRRLGDRRDVPRAGRLFREA